LLLAASSKIKTITNNQKPLSDFMLKSGFFILQTLKEYAIMVIGIKNNYLRIYT
jgi:hypothetical protein|tara:strand:+ start:1085 stop:1246 length:162 start_codon:yes stop_codon:yes gene_type:complete